MPEGMYLYTPWPCGMPDYRIGDDNRIFYRLMEFAEAAGCRMRLAGKKTQQRATRSATLTIKGVRAMEVYRVVYRETRRLLKGLGWSKIDLPRVEEEEEEEMEEQPAEPAQQEEEAEERPGEPMHEEAPEEQPDEPAQQDEAREEQPEEPTQQDEEMPQPDERAEEPFVPEWGAPDVDTEDEEAAGMEPSSPVAADVAATSSEPVVEERGDFVPAPKKQATGDLEKLFAAALAEVRRVPWVEASFALNQAIKEATAEPLVTLSQLPSQTVRRVSFCVTCFKRGWQLKCALCWNLVFAWRWRAVVSFHVVVFEDSTESGPLVAWLQEHCAAALKSGLLFLYRGKSMPYWFCPGAKNTSHRVAHLNATASAIPPEQHLLVNVDADNVFSPTFVAVLFSNVAPHLKPGGGIYLMFGGDDAGTTGRCAMFASKFTALNGFDQDLAPSGYQEIDMRERVKRSAGYFQVVKKVSGHAFSCGASLPNDPRDASRSITSAKTTNVDPNAWQGLSWGKMNNHSKAISHAKLARGVLVRNEGIAFGDLGYPVEPVLLPVGDLVPPAEAPQPAPPPVAPAPPPVPPPAPPRPPPPPVPRPPSEQPGVPSETPGPPVVTQEERRLPVLSWGCWGSCERPLAPPGAWCSLSPGKGRLVFYTIGVQIMGRLGFVNCPAASQVARYQVQAPPGNIMRALLEQMAENRAVGGDLVPPAKRDDVVAIDCRMLHDPQGGSRWHCGLHPDNIENMARHRRLEEWLIAAMSAVSCGIRRAGNHNVHVVFLCNKGRHRSVAGCTFISHLLEATSPRQAVPSHIFHMCRRWWVRYCDYCEECRTDNSAKRDLGLWLVRKAWRRALEMEEERRSRR